MDYEISADGRVSPIFVCMSKVHGFYCTHQGHIWIINW